MEKETFTTVTGNPKAPGATVEERVKALEYKVSTHRHTGVDLTKPLGVASSYGGYVTSAGAAGTPFPSGWTVAHTGAGRYTVTHNLGTTSYAVVPTALQALLCYIASRGANSFVLDCVDPSNHNAFTDNDCMFILTPQQ